MNKYFIISIIGLSLLLASCADDKEISDDNVIAGTEAIDFAGIIGERGAVNNTSLFFKAFYTGPLDPYTQETSITIQGGLMDTEANPVVFSGPTLYYPLQQDVIGLFAYTGRLQDDHMVLKAGLGDNFDAVLSNYGARQSDNGVPNKSYQGTGTLGSTDDPAKLLQFRHVMTQLILDIKVDTSEPTPVNPVPKTVKLRMNEIAAQGLYAIRASEPDPDNDASAEVASGATGTYDIQLGTNYLVPTGVDLVGKHVTHLVIDDYTATSADLAGFNIHSNSAQYPTMRLIPGYSYKLTITIRRLGIQAITLTRIPWTKTVTGSEVTYEPYTLGLDLGENYVNSDDEIVTKVVLRSSDNKMYVGKINPSGSSDLEFVSLPAKGDVVHADLYTSLGLLISTPVTADSFSGDTLKLPLSKGGMLTENPALPNSALNPYLITTPVQFINVSKEMGAFYKQAATIDLNTLNLIDATRLYNGYTGNFTGIFDGNGYGIDGLDIAAPGLFEQNSGMLRNIRILGGTVDASGQDHAGSIAGINNGMILACFNEARIINAANTVGGIVGINDANGLVFANLNTGTILQGNVVGGIVGMNRNIIESAISACVNTGMLNPNANILGVIVGNSLPTQNAVVHSSYGLVGSAQHELGGIELIVGSETVETTDSSVLYPEILRNGLLPGQSEDMRVLTRLNNELEVLEWNSEYQYIIDREKTGSTWPVPVKVE